MEQESTQRPTDDTPDSPRHMECPECGSTVRIVGGRVGKHFREIICRESGRAVSPGPPWPRAKLLLRATRSWRRGSFVDELGALASRLR